MVIELGLGAKKFDVFSCKTFALFTLLPDRLFFMSDANNGYVIYRYKSTEDPLLVQKRLQSIHEGLGPNHENRKIISLKTVMETLLAFQSAFEKLHFTKAAKVLQCSLVFNCLVDFFFSRKMT